jgi:peptide/nickel transport system substrate-binding protein
MEMLRGGTAVVAGYVDIRTMNPFATITDLNKALERYALYMPLVMLDSTLTPVPWLAESWDTTASGPDSLVLTFRLRRDVRLAGRRPTTAQDVADDVPPRHGPAVRVRGRRRAGAVQPGAGGRRLVHGPVPPAAAPRLPRGVLPAAAAAGARAGRRRAGGAGAPPAGHAAGWQRAVPLRRRSGQEWVFEANPDFPAALGGRPYLDRLVYRTTPEQTSLITEILTGRIDVAVSMRPPQVRATRNAADVRVVTFPVPNWIFIALNTRLPYFDERDERRAVAWPSTGRRWSMASWAGTM